VPSANQWLQLGQLLMILGDAGSGGRTMAGIREALYLQFYGTLGLTTKMDELLLLFTIFI
jgi:hypothetical protein